MRDVIRHAAFRLTGARTAQSRNACPDAATPAQARLGFPEPMEYAARGRFRLAILLLVALFAPSAGWAQATSVREGIVGAWSFVSVVSQTDDGRRGEPFGASPKGIIVFTPDGHFSLFQSAAEIPRLAANDRARATPEEAMTVIRNSIAYYGTYTVNESARELSLTLQGSTYANLLGGGPQRRIITTLTPTDLAFSNPRTPNGMTLHTVWRRAAPQ